jgi:uncharacterized membrane protein YhaH (DUF805 family)
MADLVGSRSLSSGRPKAGPVGSHLTVTDQEGPTGMQALHFLFSPNGRLRPQPFIYSIVAVYVVGVTSHLLTTSDVITRAGLWPFVAAQVLLIWIWFVLHARRLHDAGRGGGLAVGIGLLYVLSVILLLIVADGFFNTTDGLMGNASATGALELLLLFYVIATLLGSPHYDLGWLMVVLLMLMTFVPIVVALVFTIWTASRPRIAEA